MIEEARRAAIVAVGDELVEGRHVDTNSGEIARALATLGIDVERVEVLGDDRSTLAQTYGRLGSAYGIVISTGGMLPRAGKRNAIVEACGKIHSFGPSRLSASISSGRPSLRNRCTVSSVCGPQSPNAPLPKSNQLRQFPGCSFEL